MTDENLWTETYDRELTTANIFSIQTEISQHIAVALKTQLSPDENQSLTVVPTNNLEAYNAYVAARQLIDKRSGPALTEALALFQKANDLDPNYALAYVGQATALALLSEYSNLPLEQSLLLGEPLIVKALELNPKLAEAYTMKGHHFRVSGQFQQAESNFLYSLKLNPNYATTYQWYGVMLRIEMGRPQEALVMSRKAAELDPLSNVILVNVGWSLRATEEYDNALKQFQKLHDLSPDFPGALNGIAWVNDDLGRYSQAIIWQEKAIKADPGNILNRSWLFRHYLNIGDLEAAQRELANAQKITPSHLHYLFQQSELDMFDGHYKKAQIRLSTAYQKDLNNRTIKNDFIKFSTLSGDCNEVTNRWLLELPELLTKKQDLEVEGLYTKAQINLAWCLKQSGEKQAAERIFEKVQNDIINSSDTGTVIDGQFLQTHLYAAQGNPKLAADEYLKSVTNKKTSSWYWIDHLPYFAKTSKEPVFIKAREQLMLDLAQQRALLAEYNKHNLTPSSSIPRRSKIH